MKTLIAILVLGISFSSLASSKLPDHLWCTPSPAADTTFGIALDFKSDKFLIGSARIFELKAGVMVPAQNSEPVTRTYSAKKKQMSYSGRPGGQRFNLKVDFKAQETIIGSNRLTYYAQVQGALQNHVFAEKEEVFCEVLHELK